jgi:uncharacterized YigZ family protein
MLLPYTSPEKPSEYSERIKKSLFIGRLFPVKTGKDIEDILEDLKVKERDATHHCFAWRLGITQMLERSSDGGEPRGTAGKPLLRVLQENDLTNTLIVTTRYFGGIKLGAGGLTRAYASSGAGAVKAASLVTWTPYQRVKVAFPYHLVGAVERDSKSWDCFIEKREFTASASFTFLFLPKDLKDRETDFTNMASGRAEWNALEEVYVPLPIKG